MFKQPLSEALATCFNRALEDGKLGDSFYQGFLVLLPKEGNRTHLTNWRPITLTNVDYRLLAKILNRRLTKVIGKLVAAGQTSSVPGRKMTESLGILREYFEGVREAKGESFLLQMDQSKAFDRVDQTYLWRTLELKGVPAGFVAWLKVLYKQATVIPYVNGWQGDEIAIRSGLRQGCPLSLTLYVLALDPLLALIEQQDLIRGFLPYQQDFRGEKSERRIKFVAHADDVCIFMSKDQELGPVEQLLQEYGKASGAIINENKSKLYRLDGRAGEINGKSLKEASSKQVGDTSRHTSVRILGILFSLDPNGWEENWKKWEEGVQTRLEKWKPWKLNMYQRVKFFNTYCVPAANHLAAVYPPPQKLTDRVTSKTFTFLWRTKNFPLSRAVAYRPVKEGGLGMSVLGLFFLVTFLVNNLKRRTEGEERLPGGLQNNTWQSKGWGSKWWREELCSPRLTAASIIGLRPYVRAMAEGVNRWGVRAASIKVSAPERTVKRDIYREVVEEKIMKPFRARKESNVKLPAYQHPKSEELTAFKDQQVPFSLWETRWRAYYQVLNVGTTNPWRKEKDQCCKRVQCEKSRKNGQEPLKETCPHFVKECLCAEKLWKTLANRLNWPYLTEQSAETVLSGTEPGQGWEGPKKIEGGGQKNWKVPWSLVRIINLMVLGVLSYQRAEEAKTGEAADPRRGLERILMKIKQYAKRARVRQKAPERYNWWQWLIERNLGIN